MQWHCIPSLHSLIASFRCRQMAMTRMTLSKIPLSLLFHSIVLIVIPFVSHSKNQNQNQNADESIVSERWISVLVIQSNDFS
jgi:hypothetical protein